MPGGAESTARVGRKDKLKPKMSLMESFRFLSKSKYLGYVGLMVVSYGLAMEFTEIVWKVRGGYRIHIIQAGFGGRENRCVRRGERGGSVGHSTYLDVGEVSISRGYSGKISVNRAGAWIIRRLRETTSSANRFWNGVPTLFFRMKMVRRKRNESKPTRRFQEKQQKS